MRDAVAVSPDLDAVIDDRVERRPDEDFGSFEVIWRNFPFDPQPSP
jgi:hypothetical protein